MAFPLVWFMSSPDDCSMYYTCAVLGWDLAQQPMSWEMPVDNTFTFPQSSTKCSLYLIQVSDQPFEWNVGWASLSLWGAADLNKPLQKHCFGCQWDVLGCCNHIFLCKLAGTKAFHLVMFYRIKLSLWSSQQHDFLARFKQQVEKIFLDYLIYQDVGWLGLLPSPNYPFPGLLFCHSLSQVRWT